MPVGDDGDPEAETVDLSAVPPSLYVAECDGQPVGEFNFTAEAFRAAA